MLIVKRVKRAFTLVEIIIVILVTGIIIAVAVPNLLPSRQASVLPRNTANFRQSQRSNQGSVTDKKTTLGARVPAPKNKETTSTSKVSTRSWDQH